MANTPTPMTAARLHALLNASMVDFIASRTTEDWLALAEAHPAAIVREMGAKILIQERDLAAREAELAVAMRERNEAIQASLRDMTELAAMKQRAEAAERELESVKAENSKLRSALDIVHFKREPWQ